MSPTSSDAPAELILHHAPRTRSVIVDWMLEEIGCPCERRVLDLAQGEHKQPAFLRINPMGKVPAITHGGVVVTEVAAICCYLAETFAAAGLGVPIGDPARGPYLKWLFFAPGCLEPAIIDRMLERPPGRAQTLGYGDVGTMLGVLEGALVPGPWLLGDRFTAADVVVGSQLRWGLMSNLIEGRPAITAYVERLAARPALQRAEARDQALAAPSDG